jgi:hypothetical protein
MVNDTEYSSAGERNRRYQKIIVKDSDNPKDSKSEEKPYEGAKTNRSNNTAYQGSRLQRIMRSPITLASAVILGGVLAYNSGGIYKTFSTPPKQTYSPQEERTQSVTPKKEIDGFVGFGEIFTEGVVGSFTRPFEHVGKEGVEIINEIGKAKERSLERKAEKDTSTETSKEDSQRDEKNYINNLFNDWLDGKYDEDIRKANEIVEKRRKSEQSAEKGNSWLRIP